MLFVILFVCNKYKIYIIFAIKNVFILKIIPKKYKNNKKLKKTTLSVNTILNLILGVFYQIVVIKNCCFHIKFDTAIGVATHYF